MLKALCSVGSRYLIITFARASVINLSWNTKFSTFDFLKGSPKLEFTDLIAFQVLMRVCRLLIPNLLLLQAMLGTLNFSITPALFH